MNDNSLILTSNSFIFIKQFPWLFQKILLISLFKAGSKEVHMFACAWNVPLVS